MQYKKMLTVYYREDDEESKTVKSSAFSDLDFVSRMELREELLSIAKELADSASYDRDVISQQYRENR